MYKFSLRFFLLWTALFVGTIEKVYFAEKQLEIANWLIEGKKKIFYIILFIVKKMAGK